MKAIRWTLALAAAAAVTAGMTPVPAAPPAGAPNCELFPSRNHWNRRVDRLPRHPRSSEMVASLGRQETLHPDFGSGTWDGGPIGIPFTIVAGDQERVPVSFGYGDESDPGPYPIPPNAPIEGGPDADGDRHVIVVDRDECVLYELFDATPREGGARWTAGSGARWDLSSNALRPKGWTSADAAGLPILPGLVRYDEVANGEIDHALRFTVSRTRRHYIYPARHFASSLASRNLPAMGQRFRLKQSFVISSYPPEARVVLRALKRYGMIVADNGSDWFISGAPHDEWDNDQLRTLKRVKGKHFVVVDTGKLARP
jgi:hypothetical protein